MKVYKKDTGIVVVELETTKEVLVISNTMESLQDTVYVKRMESISAARAFLDNNRESVEKICSCLWSGLSDILEENMARG